jgi:glycosyltransferase involved in cell wall biosynthesis
MLSIYTPSHNTRWLDTAYDSLRAQDYEDWEWVVLLNAGASWGRADDSRVKIYTSTAQGVGALKRRAVELCSGEVLVELDHDDWLAPNALSEIARAFGANPDASLVYSDCTQVNEDGSPNFDKFAEGNGWTYRTEGDYQVIEAKPPTPHNVSYIWYAPNHVRAISRPHYDKAGGYDADRDICDDADLICRLYQTGPFVHISQALYYQRVHPANTQRDPEINAKIQTETVRIYDHYVQDNALAWATREGLVALDLGGAHACPEGYVPVDREVFPNQDVFEYLSHCKDESVGVVRAVDFLEHVPDKIALMNEIYRVLAPGGMLLSLTPSTDGRGAFCDPTHCSYWNELSFRYYCDEEFAKYVPAITARFRQSRLLTFMPNQWHAENNLPYVMFNGTKE